MQTPGLFARVYAHHVMYCSMASTSRGCNSSFCRSYKYRTPGNLAAIGPVWDGNEVWLIAAGGTLFFAFHFICLKLYGFYLPLMIVLWLLMLGASPLKCVIS